MHLEENVMVQFLKRFNEYPFLVKCGGREYRIGDGTPSFTVKLKKMIPAKELTTSTSLALGEAYMRGDLEIEGELYEALDHFLGQMEKFQADHSALKKLIFSSTSRRNQKKEVTSHYDIGNDFYKLWLDETMNYSCGYFLHEVDTLYQAQVNKTHYILKKLHLEKGMTLLDIGCGWGYLLIEAARKYKIKGTGITLSEEQHREFQKRIMEEGLEEYLSVELMDYRELPESGLRFDRAVSVGMVEHVGRENYQQPERVSGRPMDEEIHFPRRSGSQSQGNNRGIVRGWLPYTGCRESENALQQDSSVLGAEFQGEEETGSRNV